MTKTLMAVALALVVLLAGLLSPCMAAPLASQTSANESGLKNVNQSDSDSSDSSASAPADSELDNTVVGELVQGVSNTQLVVIGLVVVLLVAVIAAS